MFGPFKKYELTDEVWKYSAYTPEEMEIKQAELDAEKERKAHQQGFVVNDGAESDLVNPQGYGYRIRALRDIPEHGVRKGDLGGLVSNKNILSQRGNCWVHHDASIIIFGEERSLIKIADDALVYNAAFVRQFSGENPKNGPRHHLFISGNAKIGGNASVFFNPMAEIDSYITGNAEVLGECLLRTPRLVTGHVSGRAVIHPWATITDNARVLGNAIITSSATVRGNALVDGDALIQYGASVEGHSNISDNARVGQYTAVSGSATVKGNAVLMESCRITDNAILKDDVHVGRQTFIGGSVVVKDAAIIPECSFYSGTEVLSSPKTPEQKALENFPARAKANPLSYRPIRQQVMVSSTELVEGIWRDTENKIWRDIVNEESNFNDAENRLETVASEIASYESDIVKILSYPTFTDSTNPITLEMMLALRRARGMSYDDNPRAFTDAVDDLERKFMVAEANAKRVATSVYTSEDQQKVDRAHQLFAVVLDEGSTENEKKQAFAQGFKNLNGVVIIPEIAKQEMRKRSGLAELEA